MLEDGYSTDDTTDNIITPSKNIHTAPGRLSISNAWAGTFSVPSSSEPSLKREENVDDGKETVCVVTDISESEESESEFSSWSRRCSLETLIEES